MATSLSLNDLVALNAEIAGLVRSGVPLELGLASWRRDLSGPLGEVVARLHDAVTQGRSLSNALADEQLNIPPVYRAVVVAGMRSGRLPAALESLANSARNVQTLRGAVGLAVIYPLLLVLIAYFLLIVLIVVALPALVSLYEGHAPATLQTVTSVTESLLGGIPIPGTARAVPVFFLPPVLLLLAVLLWWRSTRRAVVLDVGPAGKWLGWIPVAGRSMRRARYASLVEVFGLLVEHDVPLGESVKLAASCTGEPRLLAAANSVAAEIEQGGLPSGERLTAAGVPSVLAMLITNGARQSALVAMARHVADSYRARLLRDAQWLRDILPAWLVIVVGSLIGLIFCLSFFVPFTQLLEALSGHVDTQLRIKP